MTLTPASAAVSAASSSNNNSPLNQSYASRGPTSAYESAQDNIVTPHTYPSPSSSMASAIPQRAWSERSPSPHGRFPAPGAMAEAYAAGKSPGLIRRLSRGAHQRLRRRTSHQHSMRMRDQSAGPVLVRRRSDSNGASDLVQDMSDLELDTPNDDTMDDPPYPYSIRDPSNALGITVGRPSNASSVFEGGIAPAMSAILQAGTWVIKHSKKNKRKRIKIWLDPNSARVCWHPNNPAKSFFIDDVREVRVGAESRNARDDAHIAEEHEGRWVTIVYEPPERSKGRTIKTMHLVMESSMIVDSWTEALGTVTRERTEIMNALASSTEKSERGMAIAWKKAMAKKGCTEEDAFTLDDARWLCRKLEINCSDSAVRTHFMRSDITNSGLLDYTQFKDFVNSFKERKDIQHLFRNISYGTDLDIDLDAFLTFLKNDQHAEVDKERPYWEGVFDRYAKPSQHRSSLPGATAAAGQRTMNMQGFQNFLTSGYNSPLVVTKGEPTLDRPLNEYFISSSHNTYLLGRQVAGASTVEGYIHALIKGCRCIEIDCWDGEGGRPMVTHGRTMTSKVPFEDCVSTIANPEQQRVMVDLMLKYWKDSKDPKKDMIVAEPLMNNALTLPSPDELRKRILVKVKAAEEIDMISLHMDSTNGRSRARSLGSTFNRTPSVETYNFASTPMVSSPPPASPSETTIGTPRGSMTSGPIMTPSTSSDDSDDMLTSAEKPRKSKSSKIVPELGKLGVYVQGIKYGGFQSTESKATNHIFSFSENTFDMLCSKNTDSKAMLEKHNMRHLMRVYPSAKRITSTNFNPLDSWRRGVQMAALNWQTYDVNQQVNEAMFAAGSDRLGYVLKPEELRHAKHLPIADTLPEALGKKDKTGKKLVKFTVEIKSAQRLPRPRNQNPGSGMNPYIEFEMYCAEDKARHIARGEGGTDASAPNGLSGIGSPLRKRTKITEGNGFDPIFNQPITMSVQTKYPSLIFVRWTVWNSPEGRQYSSNSVLLATFTAKLSSLQQGYRHLPLYNPHGEQYRDAKLFVKIKKEAPVPLQQEDNSVAEPSSSPRMDLRTERSWRNRVFSRNSSQRHLNEDAGLLSRTSSMERGESVR
ncbi:hypothetical protein LTR37_019352 [Vermiconidia calcicola]|uniref:Uncharacterized protein n=1 Tax=Vermiconidia calcicola TaxID=1690605 RepID=A0ACC3MEB5_9PEZI|nr:hypothetical protein LTR37_019352 [Vermiconidia calcicola]